MAQSVNSCRVCASCLQSTRCYVADLAPDDAVIGADARPAVMQELRKQTSKCPICREQVDSLLHIKMQKTSHKVPTGAAAAAAAQKIEELKV